MSYPKTFLNKIKIMFDREQRYVLLISAYCQFSI